MLCLETVVQAVGSRSTAGLLSCVTSVVWGGGRAQIGSFSAQFQNKTTKDYCSVIISNPRVAAAGSLARTQLPGSVLSVLCACASLSSRVVSRVVSRDRYECGDHVAVYPVNDSQIVEGIGSQLGVDLGVCFTLTNVDGTCASYVVAWSHRENVVRVEPCVASVCGSQLLDSRFV